MKTILLISDQSESAWASVLRNTLIELISLHIASEKDARKEVSRLSFALVIVDSGVVKKPASLVSELAFQKPDLPIAVASAAPNWREARDTLRAGAVDYFQQTLSKIELQQIIQNLLTLSDSHGRR